jgi:quercetin dioxygenase-like cupin family protein
MRVQLDVSHAVPLRPGEGETIFDEKRRTLRILADSEELTLSWFRYDPGEKGPDPHVHRKHTDAFFVLEGELEFGLGPEVQKVRGAAGTLAAAPPNVVHTFRNASDSTAVFINIHAPSMGFGDQLRAHRDGREEDTEQFDQFDPPEDGGRPFEDAVVAGAGQGERLGRPGRSFVLVKAELPELSAFDSTYDPSWEGVDPHTHDDHVDSFFVLDGEVEFILGDDSHRGGPGTFVSAPVGVRHGFRNPGGAPMRVLNLHTPDAGFAARLRGR